MKDFLLVGGGFVFGWVVVNALMAWFGERYERNSLRDWARRDPEGYAQWQRHVHRRGRAE